MNLQFILMSGLKSSTKQTYTVFGVGEMGGEKLVDKKELSERLLPRSQN